MSAAPEDAFGDLPKIGIGRMRPRGRRGRNEFDEGLLNKVVHLILISDCAPDETGKARCLRSEQAVKPAIGGFLEDGTVTRPVAHGDASNSCDRLSALGSAIFGFMDNAAQQCMRVPAFSGIEAQNVTADHGQSIVFGSRGTASAMPLDRVMHTYIAARKSMTRAYAGSSCAASRLICGRIFRAS